MATRANVSRADDEAPKVGTSCGACYFHRCQQPRAWIHGWLRSPLCGLSPSQNAITKPFKLMSSHRPVPLPQRRRLSANTRSLCFPSRTGCPTAVRNKPLGRLRLLFTPVRQPRWMPTPNGIDRGQRQSRRSTADGFAVWAARRREAAFRHF
jgi:hypothetical protein